MRSRNEIVNLCSGCKWNGGKQCKCPDLSPSIWEYLNDRGSFADMSEALSVCTRDRLQNKTATAYLCPVLVSKCGECRHYMPQGCEK